MITKTERNKTLPEIAAALCVPRHAVEYVCRVRGIKPVSQRWRRGVRYFDAAAVMAIRAAIAEREQAEEQSRLAADPRADLLLEVYHLLARIAQTVGVPGDLHAPIKAYFDKLGNSAPAPTPTPGDSGAEYLETAKANNV
ncbi:MAG: hypothetical protein DCC66_13430 [Planctomycetota bacterium]|nr:MAG: hypothetical protein DCC66_13430 [Planctomycetota bacterium]